MKKSALIQILNSFPDEFEVEEFIERVLLVEKEGARSTYDPEFVTKIQESREQVKRRERRVIDIDNL